MPIANWLTVYFETIEIKQKDVPESPTLPDVPGVEIVEKTEVAGDSHEKDENVEDEARNELRLVAEIKFWLNDFSLLDVFIIFTCSLTHW